MRCPGEGKSLLCFPKTHSVRDHTTRVNHWKATKTFLPRGAGSVPRDLQEPSAYAALAERSCSQARKAPREPREGARMAGLLLESLPGGQRPAEHLAAVLHYVAMAVGILHTVFPSPGTLDLQQTGHKLRSAPPTSAPSLGTSRARRQGGGSCDRGSEEEAGWLRGTKGLHLRLRWLSDSVPPGRCGTQLTPPPTTG